MRGALFQLVSLTSVLAFTLLTSPPSNALQSNAPKAPAYYGVEVPNAIAQGVANEQMIELLREVLTSKHQRNQGKPDSIVDKCDSALRGCYSHNPLSYNTARKLIIGELHLTPAGGSVGIEEVYCQRVYTKADFPNGPGPGPGVIVDNTVLNVEHTWPQSRFNSRAKSGNQKTDLHHLFPTDSRINADRGNFRFGEVDSNSRNLRCNESRLGTIRGERGQFFEPPVAHRGNVARALFYFSVRYDISIDSAEEKFLRKWHKEDPVDEHEMERNERIQEMQGNRNPFIDFPELVDDIENF